MPVSGEYEKNIIDKVIIKNNNASSVRSTEGALFFSMIQVYYKKSYGRKDCPE